MNAADLKRIKADALRQAEADRGKDKFDSERKMWLRFAQDIGGMINFLLERGDESVTDREQRTWNPRRQEEPFEWDFPSDVVLDCDLFDPKRNFRSIDRTMSIMTIATKHRFTVTTKHADRAAEYMERDGWRVNDIAGFFGGVYAIKKGDILDCPRIEPDEYPWPPKNVEFRFEHPKEANLA